MRSQHAGEAVGREQRCQIHFPRSALGHVECWSDDVPHGETSDFFRALKVEDSEIAVFSWIEYPSTAVRDVATARMLDDPRMKEVDYATNFVDVRRLVFGGFVPMIDRTA